MDAGGLEDRRRIGSCRSAFEGVAVASCDSDVFQQEGEIPIATAFHRKTAIISRGCPQIEMNLTGEGCPESPEGLVAFLPGTARLKIRGCRRHLVRTFDGSVKSERMNFDLRL